MPLRRGLSLAACLAIIGVLAYLVVGKQGVLHRGLVRHRSHASLSTAAIETAAARALNAAKLIGSPIDTGFPVLSNVSSGLGTPITTNGDEYLGPGHYMLAFACAGTGHIEATLSIGTSRARLRAACRPER